MSITTTDTQRSVHLAPRQTDTLLHAIQGYTVAETAQRMGVSPFTVKVYRHQLFFHFDAPNMTVVAALAIRDGYITGEQLEAINSRRDA